MMLIFQSSISPQPDGFSTNRNAHETSMLALKVAFTPAMAGGVVKVRNNGKIRLCENLSRLQKLSWRFLNTEPSRLKRWLICFEREDPSPAAIELPYPKLRDLRSA